LDGRPVTLALTIAAVLTACAPRPTAESEFQRLRAQWLVESERVRFSSRSADSTALPAFRAIVALGPSAAPAIRRHLEATGCEEDFFLAYALVEVNGWDASEVRRHTDPLGEQAFCRAVLAYGQSKTGGKPTPGGAAVP